MKKISANTNKTERFLFALSPIDRKALELLADYENVALSELLRFLIRREAKELGFWPPKVREHEQISI